MGKQKPHEVLNRDDAVRIGCGLRGSQKARRSKRRHSDISKYRKQLLLNELAHKGDVWQEHKLRACRRGACSRASLARTLGWGCANAVGARASEVARGSWQLELGLPSATGQMLMAAESPVSLLPTLHSSTSGSH